MDLYQQNIIDHYKNPRNTGKITEADWVLHEVNTLCGDALKFYVKLDQSKTKIESIKFEGEGCAISQASASMLTEELIGLTINELKTKLNQDFIKELLGIEISPSRMKCATLCIECLRKALK